MHCSGVSSGVTALCFQGGERERAAAEGADPHGDAASGGAVRRTTDHPAR